MVAIVHTVEELSYACRVLKHDFLSPFFHIQHIHRSYLKVHYRNYIHPLSLAQRHLFTFIYAIYIIYILSFYQICLCIFFRFHLFFPDKLLDFKHLMQYNTHQNSVFTLQCLCRDAFVYIYLIHKYKVKEIDKKGENM